MTKGTGVEEKEKKRSRKGKKSNGKRGEKGKENRLRMREKKGIERREKE